MLARRTCCADKQAFQNEYALVIAISILPPLFFRHVFDAGISASGSSVQNVVSNCLTSICREFVMPNLLIFRVVIFISLVLFPVVQSAAAEPLRNGVYIIQMSNSDMTAAATSESGNSPMILWPYRPTATWAFQHVGNNVYTIRTNSTLLSGGGGEGSSATISRASKGDEQKWKLKRVGGMYQIINQKTGLALTLSNGKRAKGSKLRSERVDAGDAQLFCIQKPSAPRFCGGAEGRDDYPDMNEKDKEVKIKSYINNKSEK